MFSLRRTRCNLRIYSSSNVLFALCQLNSLECFLGRPHEYILLSGLVCFFVLFVWFIFFFDLFDLFALFPCLWLYLLELLCLFFICALLDLFVFVFCSHCLWEGLFGCFVYFFRRDIRWIIRWVNGWKRKGVIVAINTSLLFFWIGELDRG